jgi:hypothetical protein
MAFDDMKDHDFYDAFSFFIARKQNERRCISPHHQTPCRQPSPPPYSPYTRPRSTSISRRTRSPIGSDDPRSNIDTSHRHGRRSLNSALSSNHMVDNEELGSREHIYIVDDDDEGQWETI